MAGVTGFHGRALVRAGVLAITRRFTDIACGIFESPERRVAGLLGATARYERRAEEHNHKTDLR